MTSKETIRSIVDQYDRNGWTLRRILLSPESQDRLGPAVSDLFGDIEVKRSDIDACWFSRASRGNSTAWELRWLSEFPFALIEVIDEGSALTEVERILRETEDQLKERINKRMQIH